MKVLLFFKKYYFKILSIVLICAISFCVICFGIKKARNYEILKGNKTQQNIFTIWHIETFEGGGKPRIDYLKTIARDMEKQDNQVLFMIKNELDYSITDLDLFNESDKLIDQRKRTYIKSTSRDALLEYHLKYHITGTDAMMFHKDYIDAIGGFSPIDVGDEFYLMQRAIEGNGNFGYLPVCDIKAYVHTGDSGLSSGQSKIDGENILFENKKKYFSSLKKRTIRYIKARHYAVLAYAFWKMKRYREVIKNLLYGMLSSPLSFCRIVFNR